MAECRSLFSLIPSSSDTWLPALRLSALPFFLLPFLLCHVTFPSSVSVNFLAGALHNVFAFYESALLLNDLRADHSLPNLTFRSLPSPPSSLSPSHPCLSRVGLIHVLPPSGNLTTLKPTRLFLLAGSRAYRSLLSASRDLSSLASLLACTREDALERVGQREAQRSAMGKGVTAMRAELGKLVGRSLEWTSGSGGSSNGARSLDDTASSSTTTNSTSTVRVASLSRSDESTHDFEFLNLVQTSAVARLIELDGRDPTRRGETPDGPYVLALTSSLPGGGGAGAAGGDAALTLVHITSQPADLATRVADRLKTAMQALDPAAAGTGNDRIKGGGARGRWMGKVSGKWGKREKLAWEEVLAGVARGGEL